MCIHHIFEYEDKRIPSTLTLSGETIDEYYTIERAGSLVHFHPTSSYVEILHRKWNTMLAQIRNAEGEYPSSSRNIF
jgi:hypothetical protein